MDTLDARSIRRDELKETENRKPPKGGSGTAEFNSVKDSGQRTEFSTGARRDRQAGKGMPHLIPTHFLRRLAKHFENGATKYGKDNWKKGIPLSSYIDSSFRHWCAILEGLKDEDHACSLIWNMACFMETVEMIHNGTLPRELDDIGWFTDVDFTKE